MPVWVEFAGEVRVIIFINLGVCRVVVFLHVSFWCGGVLGFFNSNKYIHRILISYLPSRVVRKGVLW